MPDRLSAGLRPLVCLAGTLGSFHGAAEDLLRRFAGVRLSAATARRATEQQGARLASQQQAGAVVTPARPRAWDLRIEGHRHSVAYLGVDAFSVPIQGHRGAKADHRMIYTAVLYTPDKGRSHYLADFDLGRLVAQMRRAAIRLGLGAAGQLIAITDAGNGIEAALRRHFDDEMLCILDWYHAGAHLHDYAKCLHAHDPARAAAWAKQAKEVLYERGGGALLGHLREQAAPADALVADELRKLIGYFTETEHRTDYPNYRKHGYDIGSGPTEAACKIVGARLKQSGMRWAERGAAEVAPLRALYESGPEVWDAFWALAS